MTKKWMKKKLKKVRFELDEENKTVWIAETIKGKKEFVGLNYREAQALRDFLINIGF